MLSARNKPLFTASQWQELEHQALVYKYIVSGIPVPPELLCSVKMSLASSSTRLNSPHHPSGLGCFQVGYGRKADPEPGRCRRTDGKKWRCSKEAYADSRYCEKHMHRGRNRSRKPVESTTTTTTTAATTTYTRLSSTSKPDLITTHHPTPSVTINNNVPSCFFAPPSSSRPPPSGSGSAAHNSLFLDSASHVIDRDHRYFVGDRNSGGADERAFFRETASSTTKRTANFQNFVGSTKQDQQQEQERQHCFVLGADFKSSTSSETTAAAAASAIKLEKGQIAHDDTSKQQHHHFSQRSWLDLASNTSRDN